MELIVFIQVFNIIVIAIGTLLYMCCRSFSSSSPAVDSAVPDSAADSTAVKDDDDADNPPRREKYDVFISFRGEDTRRGITSHLHSALLAKKITTYIDDKLKRGDEIKPALRKAIEESELSVIIFSKDYASSTWCLDELVHILECKEKHGQLVIPIFYGTLPSDVRKQRGSYALDLLEQRFENRIDKVRKWRAALTNAGNMSGFDSKNYRTDADLVTKVVEDIWTKLCLASSCDLKGFVGIESRIEQVESLLGIHQPDACITVGIWGMGGIGKTTLAEAVLRRHSSKFEASSFLKNVRENSEQASGLDYLEKTLLKEILKEEVSLPVGSTFQERLSRTKVLIVLDDVSDSMQLERLAGSPLRFGTGSRIIITTRDRGTLGQTVEEDNIYKVEELKPDDALQLFYSRAFKDNSTHRTDYKELAEKVVAYAKGVPLALTVLGSLFFNCKSKDEWEDEFNKLKRFPDEDIQKVLKISYDRLRENEKEIFLDIACFHKGMFVVEVKRMLDVRGFFVASGIRILIGMSLISIDSKGGRETIEMHDLLQEMGGKIVQEQGIKDPGKRSRLSNDEDVYRVLRSSTETPNVEAIQINWYNLQERPLEPLEHANFKKMSNLIMLMVGGRFEFTASLDLPDSLRYLYWRGYPLESLPSKFSPKNLVELHLPDSKVKELWKEEQLLHILVNLQVIDLQGCSNLTEVPSSIGNLNGLQDLNLSCCDQLKDVPTSIYSLSNLKRLSLGFCYRLEKLPSSSVGFLSLEVLDLSCSGILEIPASIKQASRLSILDLGWCNQLQSIPELPVLCNVNAERCKSLKMVSSSRTALTQGWDKPHYCYRVFTKCPKLDNNSRSNIMDEAQITMMRMATVAPFKYHSWFRHPWIPNPWPQINIACPGKEIPNWFSYQNEGSSVDIELLPDWYQTGLFGFALSVVVSVPSMLWFDGSRVRANFIVKFMGENHVLFSSKYIIPGTSYGDGRHHVHVWNEAFRSEKVGKNCSPDVYKLAKEASLVFCVVDLKGRPPFLHYATKVESCGICPLYSEDAEKFKFGHVFMSRGSKVEETRQDDDSKGGGSRDEPLVSGSSDESEANEGD